MRDEPVAVAGGCGGHTDDGLGEWHGAGGAVEGRAEGEDATVGRDEPVAAGARDQRPCRRSVGRADVAGGAVIRRGEGEYATVGCHEAVAAADRLVGPRVGLDLDASRDDRSSEEQRLARLLVVRHRAAYLVPMG